MKRKKQADPGAVDTKIAADAQKALAQTPPPSVDDPNIMQAVESENAKAKKRKGRASTLLGGSYEQPASPKTVLEMKY